MDAIEPKVFTKIRRPTGTRQRFEELSGWLTVVQVRQSLGPIVRSYPQLVRTVAELATKNHRLNLLFRGQAEDYPDRNGRTSIYPSLYRAPRGKKMLPKPVRLARLDDVARKCAAIEAHRKDIDGSTGILRHREAQIALLQHYGKCLTPLLDLTHSLRVAASFALGWRAHATGVLYVLGMPHPHGTISHYVDEDITLVKLQAACPPRALRPHYQDAYLAGRLTWEMGSEKTSGDNAARRLVAKLVMDDTEGTFWSNEFPPLPEEALLPPKDPFDDELDALLATYAGRACHT